MTDYTKFFECQYTSVCDEQNFHMTPEDKAAPICAVLSPG